MANDLFVYRSEMLVQPMAQNGMKVFHARAVEAVVRGATRFIIVTRAVIPFPRLIVLHLRVGNTV